jgi:hypothetical protein
VLNEENEGLQELKNHCHLQIDEREEGVWELRRLLFSSTLERGFIAIAQNLCFHKLKQ